MKRLLIALFVLGIALPSFANLKEKDVIGKWKYEVETDQGIMTGFLTFEKKDGELTGEVTTDMGESFPMTKVEIRDDNVLYFELQPDYDVIWSSVTVDKKKFTGTVGSNEMEMPITGEKIE